MRADHFLDHAWPEDPSPLRRRRYGRLRPLRHIATEREQFGRRIGSFLTVSHRCADMLVALEGARSEVFAAAEAGPLSEVG